MELGWNGLCRDFVRRCAPTGCTRCNSYNCRGIIFTTVYSYNYRGIIFTTVYCLENVLTLLIRCVETRKWCFCQLTVHTMYQRVAIVRKQCSLCCYLLHQLTFCLYCLFRFVLFCLDTATRTKSWLWTRWIASVLSRQAARIIVFACGRYRKNPTWSSMVTRKLCWCSVVCVDAVQSVLIQCSLCWYSAVCVDAVQSVLIQCSLCWCSTVCVDAVQSVLIQCSLCWCSTVCVDTVQSVLIQCSLCWYSAVCVDAVQSVLMQYSLCWCSTVYVDTVQSVLIQYSLCWCSTVCVDAVQSVLIQYSLSFLVFFQPSLIHAAVLVLYPSVVLTPWLAGKDAFLCTFGL